MWELAEALNYGPAKNDGKQTPILERLEMGKFNFPRKIVIIFSSCDEKSKSNSSSFKSVKMVFWVSFGDFS